MHVPNVSSTWQHTKGKTPVFHLSQIDKYFEKDLMKSLQIYRESNPGENVIIKDDFDDVQHIVSYIRRTLFF